MQRNLRQIWLACGLRQQLTLRTSYLLLQVPQCAPLGHEGGNQKRLMHRQAADFPFNVFGQID